jgi:uncharacterized protein YqeY
MAALKDKDIEARGQGKKDILALLQESQEIYEKNRPRGPRLARKRGIAIIHGVLPQQLSEAEVARAIAAAIAKTKAPSLKDMGWRIRVYGLALRKIASSSASMGNLFASAGKFLERTSKT